MCHLSLSSLATPLACCEVFRHKQGIESQETNSGFRYIELLIDDCFLDLFMRCFFFHDLFDTNYGA